MATPLLGWISPAHRTPAQWRAVHQAWRRFVPFQLGRQTVPKGTKVILTKLWADPLIVADVGREFTGFRQLTGSCVGVSTGNAIATLSMVQRKLAVNPTKAFVPWWGLNYGLCRQAEGDSEEGEGAIDSVMGETLRTKGSLDIATPGLPTIGYSDGWAVSSSDEMHWSAGANIPQPLLDLAKTHVLKSAAALGSIDQIAAAIQNGYPVLDGCDEYVGNGSIRGSGADAYVCGQYDGSGGHSTCFLGYWEHPSDGPLYLYSNQWAGSTYPQDPGGAGRCCVWMLEKDAKLLFSKGGGSGETMALSGQDWFPAQPEVINWYA